MEEKKAGVLGSILGAIPYFGGAISGWVDPLNGLSRNESSAALSSPSFTASAAAPVGMMFGKMPRGGNLKQMAKDLILKSLVASGVASGISTEASRFMKNRHFGKTAADLYFEELNKEAFGIGDVASGIGGIVKSTYIDPAKNIFKDSGDAFNALRAGDYQNAGGRAMSAAGNALWTGMNFIPGLGTLGKAISGGSKAVAEGVAATKGLENAGAIASKITEGGARIGKAVAKPAEALASTKGTPLGGLLGQGWLARKTQPGIFKGIGAMRKGQLSGGSYLAERARRSLDFGASLAPSIGLNVGGDLVSATSPTEQMKMLTQDPGFEKYIGRGLMGQIKNLPLEAQVVVYKKLKERGLLDRYDDMIASQQAG